MKIITLIFALLSTAVFPQQMGRIIDLRGDWKFSIGDRQEWSSPTFKDGDWESIRVPSTWEDEGFHGYDGYAWYRKSFYLSKEFAGKSFMLQMGMIDDVDEVYINGKSIGGAGTFPPNYETAYNVYRNYPVPQSFLNLNGTNLIAVRVYDSQLGGGITDGEIGLYYLRGLIADYNLEGTWKFQTGDSPEWKETDFNDKNWKNIIVPGYWENFGFKGYDGMGWYRTSFPMPENLKGRRLVLLLGKIDDLDQVYLNGVLIGQTGNVDEGYAQGEYQKLRGYFIPDGLLKDKNNIIAVRVLDTYLDGGIYQGPIGLIRQEKYTKYWQNQRRKKNIFEIIFGD